MILRLRDAPLIWWTFVVQNVIRLEDWPFMSDQVESELR